MNARVRQREERWECKKLRDSARDRDCTMNSPWCDNVGVVWAHSNFSEHGKGVGLKCHDIFGCYCCGRCHVWFDTMSKQRGFSNDERRHVFQRAFERTLLIVVSEGVLK